jgi:uncharacterized protein DUF3822
MFISCYQIRRYICLPCRFFYLLLQPAKKITLRQLFNITGNPAIDTASSVLMLELGEKHCCFAIAKRPNFEPVKLVYYETDEKGDGLLEEVKLRHQELNGAFGDVLVNYTFPQSMMIPPVYYDSENNRKMLNALYGEETEVSFLSEHLPEWQLYNVYEVPKPAHSWISMQYRSGKYWHHYSLVLKNFSADAGTDILYVDFKTGQFSVILIRSGQLHLTQTFIYSSTHDAVYYLLKICSEFSVSQKEVSIVLSGLIEEQSSLYKELYNYFIHIAFQQIPANIVLPQNFGEYPAYYFSSLFNLATCAS